MRDSPDEHEDGPVVDGAVASTEKTTRPIVPFLVLDDPPHLAGLRCRICGTTFLKSGRVACARCGAVRELDTVRLSDRGVLWVYSIVHQSLPGVPVPYVAAIVDLPDGVAVRCTLLDVEPDPAKLPFGMPLRMMTRTVRTDRDGREVIAFFFTPERS